MKKNWIRIAGTLALLVALCVGAYFVSTATRPQPANVAVKPGTQVAHLVRSDFKHPPPPPPPVVEAAPAYDDPGASITYCPSGTVAGAVDGYGNESNCYETNDAGQTCAEYDDANNCTAWYQP